MTTPYMNVTDRIAYGKQQQQMQQQQQQYSMLHDTQQQQRTMASRLLPGTMHFPGNYQQQQQQQQTHNMTINTNSIDARYHLHSQQQQLQQQKQHLNGCTYGGNSMQYNDTGGYYNQNVMSVNGGNSNNSTYMQYENNAITYNQTTNLTRNRYSPYAQPSNGIYLNPITQQLMPSNLLNYSSRQALHSQQQLQQQQHYHQQQLQMRRSQAFMYETAMDNHVTSQHSHSSNQYAMQQNSFYTHLQNTNACISQIPAYNQQQYAAMTDYHAQQEQRTYQQQSQISLARPTPALTPALDYANRSAVTQSSRLASACAPISHDAFLSHPQAQSPSSSSSLSSTYGNLQYTAQSNFISSSAPCGIPKLPIAATTAAAANTITTLPSNNTEQIQTSKMKRELDLVPSPHSTIFGVNANSPSSANPGSCLTTSPPLISASGTDSGLSSCSTGRQRGAESTQSTPVYTYSNEYPMSVGSSSGISYNFSDGKELDEMIKDKDETMVTFNDSVTEMEQESEATTTSSSTTKATTTPCPKNYIEKDHDKTLKTPKNEVNQSDIDKDEKKLIKSEQPDQEDVSEEETADDSIGEINKRNNDELQDDSNCPSSASLDCQPAESSDGQPKAALSISSSKNSSTNSDSSTPPDTSPASEHCLTPILSPSSKTQDLIENYALKCSPAPSFSSLLSTLDNETKTKSPTDCGANISPKKDIDEKVKTPCSSPQLKTETTPTSPDDSHPANKSPPLRTPSPAQIAMVTNDENKNDPNETTEFKNKTKQEINELLEKGLCDASIPLPAFQQAFGSTEIGRFSETFGEHHMPNDLAMATESFDAALNEVFSARNSIWENGTNNIAGFSNNVNNNNNNMPWVTMQQQLLQQHQRQLLNEQQLQQMPLQQQLQQLQQTPQSSQITLSTNLGTATTRSRNSLNEVYCNGF